MSNILYKIRNTRILAGTGIICLILGILFTYVKFEVWEYSQSLSLWSYMEGKVVMIIVIANMLFIFKEFVQKYIPSIANSRFGKKLIAMNNPKLSLIPTLIAAALIIYLHFGLELDPSYASYGLGFYLLWVGIICLVAYAFLYKNNNEYEYNM